MVSSQIDPFPASTEAAASRADLPCLPRHTLLVLWELAQLRFESFFPLNSVIKQKAKMLGGVFMFVCVLLLFGLVFVCLLELRSSEPE